MIDFVNYKMKEKSVLKRKMKGIKILVKKIGHKNAY